MAVGVRLGVCCVLSLLLVTQAQSPMCPFGKMLSQCSDDNCSPVCGTSGPPAQCPPCFSDCFCSPGLYQFGDLCLPMASCPDSDFDDIPVIDKCSQYGNCSECISSDPDCQWCPYEPGEQAEQAVIGSRCRDRETNPLCPTGVEDPQSNITEVEDEDFGDMVQRRPQKLRLKLRRGEPQNFTLQFRAAENFPLDVYFLLDATGSFSQRFRTTVSPLAAELLSALSNISDQYAVAFGGFADKRAIPYALPSQDFRAYYTGTAPNYKCTSQNISNLSDCNPTISFRHTTNFSRLEGDQLTDVLENISIHLNVDGLEGGMDGLVQVLTCSEQIGWREQSLRMLLYMSNAGFHLAGDGKVGAVLDPNPGTCLLKGITENEMTFDEYTDDTRYDYPSVYQLSDLARTSETNIVFAVTSEGSNPNALRDVYEDLAKELRPFGRVVALEANSSNLISVIEEAFNEISEEVVLFPQQFYEGLNFIFTPEDGCGRANEGLCTDVTIGETVNITVTVNMTSCDAPSEAVLTSPAFGNVRLLIEPLCDCDCNRQIMNDSELCGGRGDLQCGQCQCPEGWAGEMCECPVAPGEDPPTCGNDGLKGLECSGPDRGECDCGTCKCFVQERLLREKNFTEAFFGPNCECDHFESCGGNLTDDGKLCSGNGTCLCTEDRCECDIEPTTMIRYGGDLCECDPSVCYSQQNQDICVYTGSLSNLPNADSRAECDACTGCKCRAGTIQGPDGTCDPQSDLCQLNMECARCEKNIPSQGVDCSMLQDCNATLYTGEKIPSGEVCTFVDEDNCIHTFYVQTSQILVEDDRDCGDTRSGGPGNLVWIIPVAIIAALLVLGGLILLLVFLIVCIKDRMEYSHFKQDLEDPSNWDQQENPMYVSPSTQYSNVIYRPKAGQTAPKE